MKKNLLISLLVLVIMTGCGKQESELKLKTKGNCDAMECIDKINPENTVEEVNDIIGIDGELTDEKYNRYYWELSDESGIEVTYYNSSKGTITVDIDTDLLKNSKVDFSNYDEIKKLLDDGTSLTYDEFVKKVGGVEGTLIEKSSITKKYIWVNSEGGYLRASFSQTSGKCTIVTGRF